MRKRGMKLKVGVVRFPGSNCDFDTLNFFRRAGHAADFVWHKTKRLLNWDILILPGGFAFGDRVYKRATGKFYVDPGVQALHSPVMDAVKKYAAKGRPILGICNGFQILTHARLLPGELIQNTSKKFYCDFTPCKVEGKSFFKGKNMLGKIFQIPVAHGYGRYNIDAKSYKELAANGQIFLRYENNPNGSYKDIAGACNKEGTIFGMMPHPERMQDGSQFIKAIEEYVRSKK